MTRTRKAWLACLLILTLLACAACSAYDLQAESSGGKGSPSDSLKPDENDGGSSLQLGETDPARKMVYRVAFTMETLDFDKSVQTIHALLADFGGYMESSKTTGGTRGDGYITQREALYVLRIPSDQLDALFARIGDVGNILSESLTSEDVTLQYIDIESRLNAYRAQEARILELISGATDLKYLLEIEQALSDIRYQIESYTSQLNKLSALIGYSTVTVTLYEVYSITASRNAPRNFGERLADTFSDSVSRIWNGIQSAGVWFLGNILEIVLVLGLLALCGFLLFLLIRRLSRPSRRVPPMYTPPYPAPPPHDTTGGNPPND